MLLRAEAFSSPRSEVPSPLRRARVRVLSDMVVNQIAAGEVVERPASVVKELVENAIDAGATDIAININQGGRSRIEVMDDGTGMTEEDAILALERFGTSKVSSLEDLESIGTLGFRGEALPSIAAVSKFTLRTAPFDREDGLGTELVVDGGKLHSVTSMPLPRGTRVQVDRLFFNVPARRGFLRSEKTEQALIRTVLIDFAASYPAIAFRFVADGREIFSFLPLPTWSDRLRQLKLSAGEGAPFEQHRETPFGRASIACALSSPHEAISGGARLRLIVNGRAVRDNLLLKAVRDAFGLMLKPGKYPTGIILLTLPPEEVDVNVHPQKTEVRFRSPQEIFRFVSGAVREALAATKPLAAQGSSPAMAFIHQPRYTATDVEFRPAQTTAVIEEMPHPLPPAPVQLSTMRFVGQIFGCYLVMEGENEFAMVDMHAAHERISYFELKTQLSTGVLRKQLLLIPEVVNLPMALGEDFLSNIEQLSRLGIELEALGDDQVIVRSLPALLGAVSSKQLFAEISALDLDWGEWGNVIEERLASVIARLACHGSVRSGRELKAAEVYHLLERLEQVELSAFCPHGRPIAWKLSSTELAQMFDRS